MSDAYFVFDTSVLFSAMISPQGKPRKALDKAHTYGYTLLSEAVIEEIVDVCNRIHAKKYITQPEIDDFLLSMHPFRNIPIIAPADFLEWPLP